VCYTIMVFARVDIVSSARNMRHARRRRSCALRSVRFDKQATDADEFHFSTSRQNKTRRSSLSRQFVTPNGSETQRSPTMCPTFRQFSDRDIIRQQSTVSCPRRQRRYQGRYRNGETFDKRSKHETFVAQDQCKTLIKIRFT